MVRLRIEFHDLREAAPIGLMGAGADQTAWIAIESGRARLCLVASAAHRTHLLVTERVITLCPHDERINAGALLGPLTFWRILVEVSPATMSTSDAEAFDVEIDDQRLQAALGRITTREFAGSSELFMTLRRFHELASRACAGEIDQLAVETTARSLLVRLVQDAAVPPRPTIDAATTHVIRDLARRLDAEVSDPPTWTDLSREMGWNAERLWQTFRQATGLSPTEFTNRRRVARALRLMRRGTMTYTQIAHAVGFSTSQYFAVVFRRLKGTSPTAYMRREKPPSFLP